MAFLADFKYDIFISYARVDDIPTINKGGWVSSFVSDLRRFLAQRLGRIDACTLWMDREMPGNVAFTESKMDAVCNSAVLLVVYLESLIFRKMSKLTK